MRFFYLLLATTALMAIATPVPAHVPDHCEKQAGVIIPAAERKIELLSELAKVTNKVNDCMDQAIKDIKKERNPEQDGPMCAIEHLDRALTTKAFLTASDDVDKKMGALLQCIITPRA